MGCEILSSGHKVAAYTHELIAVLVTCNRPAHEPVDQNSNIDKGGAYRTSRIVKEIFSNFCSSLELYCSIARYSCSHGWFHIPAC